jgi:hypothetical protein
MRAEFGRHRGAERSPIIHWFSKRALLVSGIHVQDHSRTLVGSAQRMLYFEAQSESDSDPIESRTARQLLGNQSS